MDGGGCANRRQAIGHCDWIRRAQRQLVASRCPCPAACSDAASGGRCDRRAQSGLSCALPFQTSIGSLSLTGSPSSSKDGTESAVSDCGPCTGERNAQPPVVRARSPWVNHHPAGVALLNNPHCSGAPCAATLVASCWLVTQQNGDAIFALLLRFGRWRHKRYQLDAERHRADTKGMYRGRTGRAGNGLLLLLKLIFSQPLHARRES